MIDLHSTRQVLELSIVLNRPCLSRYWVSLKFCLMQLLDFLSLLQNIKNFLRDWGLGEYTPPLL